MKKRVTYPVCIAAALLAAGLLQKTANGPEQVPQELSCTISLDGYRSSTMRYSIGFAYEMLRDFGRDNAISMDIRLLQPGDSLLPSDIVVQAAADSLRLLPEVSTMLPDSTIWTSSSPLLARRINAWLSHKQSSPGFEAMKERFTPSYEPYKRALSGRIFPNASPYDKLLKSCAASIGWDWRMLAALVWRESAFRIEAVSPKGARGLVQMMPSTADKYSSGDMLDPEVNLMAATAYLSRLQQLFNEDVSDPFERMKFTLAAYNAGEGRIKDCIALARSQGKPHSTWLELEAVLPDMREASIAENENVRLGVFKGYETMEYVREMQSLYWAFCIIAPGGSLPGQFAQSQESQAAEEAESEDTQTHQQQALAIY